MVIDRSIPILVVADSAAIVRIVRSLLRHIGFIGVDESDDGGTALPRCAAKATAL
jgi:two-component system chemotaxis response regulator CheY